MLPLTDISNKMRFILFNLVNLSIDVVNASLL